MSYTFTKLFSSITESSIWVAPDSHRLVWITLLAMSDRMGRVWASIPGLANRARVTVPDAEAAITSFLQPDPYSRTKDHDGRRIEEIDGGWRLINYLKYREIRDSESIRESKRRYINARREKERRQSKGVSTVDRGRHIAEAEAEAEAETNKKKKQPFRPPDGWQERFQAFWESYPKNRNGKRLGRQTCEALFQRLRQEDWPVVAQAARHYAEESQATDRLVRDPERFLKHGWWREWIDQGRPQGYLAGYDKEGNPL